MKTTSKAAEKARRKEVRRKEAERKAAEKAKAKEEKKKEKEREKIRKAFLNGICSNHRGKMYGLASLSTNPKDNARCKARAACGDCVCAHCFAQAMLEDNSPIAKNMTKKLSRNFELLNARVYDKKELPLLNYLYFRYESFGDLASPEHFANFNNLAKRNPETKFTLWTKNPDIVAAGIEKYGSKARNLIIIYSSPLLNFCHDPGERYPFIDKVFTVYTADFAAENGIEINCGARSCRTCLRCYKKNKTRYVNEVLKSEAAKYYKLTGAPRP